MVDDGKYDLFHSILMGSDKWGSKEVWQLSNINAVNNIGMLKSDIVL